MFKNKFLFFFFGFLLLASFSSFSQNYDKNNKSFFANWKINIDGGINLFYGDIQQYRYAPYKEDYRLAYSLSLHKQLSPVFGFGGQLLNGKLHGTRISSVPQSGSTEYTGTGVYFDADVFEYNLNSTINFSNLFGKFDPYRKFSIYGLAGIGFSNWKTEVKDYNTDDVLRRSGFTGSGLNKRTTEIVIPIGLGLNINLNNSFGINFQSTIRGVNSDKLDATVSGRKYDYYNYTSLGFSYNFNNLNISLKNTDKRHIRYQRKIENEARRDMKAYSKQDELEKRIAKRRKMDDKKLEQREQMKKSKSRNKSFRELAPQAAEYDIISTSYYSSSDSKTYKNTIGIAKINEDPPQKKETIIDEGKFIITGNQPSSSNITYNAYQQSSDTRNTITPQTQQSQNIISPQTNYNQQDQTPQSGVIFRIQIMAKYQKRANIQQLANLYNINQSIIEEYIDGYYKYTAGMFYNYNNAVNYKNVLTNKGIVGAFIIAYRNGNRVSLRSVL
ncbi:MAG: hypothetical protein K8R41_11400 [Bacteroidales bacterium]|nr:hypothetical protein [Bacteroidales bacterium]